MATHERQRRYQRRIPDSQRGVTFETRQEFEDAVRQQCRNEFIKARSADALDRFLRGLAELSALVEDEVRAHAAIKRMLSSLDAAIETAERLRPHARAAPSTLVSTRALARMLEEVEEFRATLNSQLNLSATDSVRASVGADPNEDVGFWFALSSWRTALRRVSWSTPPTHRDLVFLALREAGLLRSRRAFRFLAAASLLSGGELITFWPKGTEKATTVADAVAYEFNRMTEVALRLAPSWAENIPVDESAVELERGEDWIGFIEWPEPSDPPADVPAVDEAA